MKWSQEKNKQNYNKNNNSNDWNIIIAKVTIYSTKVTDGSITGVYNM